ncbi:site-specific integrase [Arthrobacter sp. BB-1]|uniref:tyrosine-type recombinase/integrase n=1 Tax=unclassified Arthrobacter TaxID=235627 RepID=UPI0010E78840|nr:MULTISPECIES: tyrosine-type recombinase/integrase [unclassified Arthrobacter]TNB75612.1 site-specific integrase [Arthrobacter sp. BB-1]VII98787.1 Phage integrase [Arthrobacter sp. DR-2P]
MGLATVRSIGFSQALRSAQDEEDFEQELVDQFALAQVGAGVTDQFVRTERSVIFEFARFLGRYLWTASPSDGDRFLAYLRHERGQARSTREGKAGTLARFYDFVIGRYQGDIHALTGYVVIQPIDEFNRPSSSASVAARVPPSDSEVELLFTRWRDGLPEARKYLPAARDYLAASLWRRAGLRINETLMLDIKDWRPDLGQNGKIHVRFGKGSRGRGAKPRLVPAINSVDVLLQWWLTDVRHQFGDDYLNPDAPLFPSERRDRHTGGCARVGDDALRAGLAGAVERWLPAWRGRLSPHGLRHYCASSLYARGLDLKAVQELLGHEWLSTTTRYIHVHSDHIDHAWAVANERVAARLTGE